MRQQCSEGYYGPMCSLCVKDNSTHYGRTGNLECKPCKSKGTIVAAYIGSTILVLLFLSFVIQLTLQENEDTAAGMQNVGRTSELIKARPPTASDATLFGAALPMQSSGATEASCYGLYQSQRCSSNEIYHSFLQGCMPLCNTYNFLSQPLEPLMA